MPTLTATNQEAASLTPTALLNLFLLDLSQIGINQQYYFVDGTSSNYQSIVFGGQTYTPFPVIIDGAGYEGQGSINRPKLRVSNIGGFVSNLLLLDQDLVGASVTWTRVFARFIDAVNYPNGVSPYTPDPAGAYAPEVYFVNRKIEENQQQVSFELSTSFELDGRRLPSRTCLANFCSWSYRGPGCNYTGVPIADAQNNLFSGPPYSLGALTNRGTWSSGTNYSRSDYVTTTSANQSLLGVPLVFVCLANNTSGLATNPLIPGTLWVMDGCAHQLAGCRLHFTGLAVLPFGGFGGLTSAPFVAGYSTTQS